MNVPRLSKRALGRQILARWLRLAFPTYLVVLISVALFPYLNNGPMFEFFYDHYVKQQVGTYWWTYILFISNLVPFNNSQGLYWLFFTANELQFCIFVLAPAVYMYQRRYRRRLVLNFLGIIIALSVLYIFLMSLINDFSILLTVDILTMFDELYRYPFGPVGYYSLGIVIAIFYFEY
jgi:hypothetical protein